MEDCQRAQEPVEEREDLGPQGDEEVRVSLPEPLGLHRSVWVCSLAGYQYGLLDRIIPCWLEPIIPCQAAKKVNYLGPSEA